MMLNVSGNILQGNFMLFNSIPSKFPQKNSFETVSKITLKRKRKERHKTVSKFKDNDSINFNINKDVRDKNSGIPKYEEFPLLCKFAFFKCYLALQDVETVRYVFSVIE